MYIPKKNRFEVFLKRKSSTASSRSNHTHAIIYNTGYSSLPTSTITATNTTTTTNSNGSSWSDICTDFIMDIIFRKGHHHDNRSSTNSDNATTTQTKTTSLFNDPDLCLEQLSEFQRSYVSFPEFSESSIISHESDINL